MLSDSMEKQKIKLDEFSKEIIRLNTLINVLFEENQELQSDNNHLKHCLQTLTTPADLNDEWTLEDAKLSEDHPEWWYIRPFTKIIQDWLKLCPALSTALNEAMTTEKEANVSAGAGRIIDAPTEELLITFKESFSLIERPPTTETLNTSCQTDTAPKIVSQFCQTESDSCLSTHSDQVDTNPSTSHVQLSSCPPSVPPYTGTIPKTRPSPTSRTPVNHPIDSPQTVSTSQLPIVHSPKRQYIEEAPILKENFCYPNKSRKIDPTFRTKKPAPSRTRQNTRSPSPNDSSCKPKIPSLLRVTVELPDNIDPETVIWLKRQPVHGCWNCGHPRHGHADCPHPPLRLFCGECGNTIPPSFYCWNSPFC